MFSILFKFVECFSQFFGKDDWSQIVKRQCTRMDTLGYKSYGKQKTILRCSYCVYVESGKQKTGLALLGEAIFLGKIFLLVTNMGDGREGLKQFQGVTERLDFVSSTFKFGE